MILKPARRHASTPLAGPETRVFTLWLLERLALPE
jgi:hypothetical protein